MSIPEQQKFLFTDKQGQYLAFIHYDTKLNRVPPAHTDMQAFFEVSPPTVNQMITTLEKKRLIEKLPRTARNIRVQVPTHLIPELK